MSKGQNKDPFKPRPAFQPIDPKLRGEYAIYRKGDDRIVHAKGPSLNAILAELGWSINEIVATQLSSKGDDVVMVVKYMSTGKAWWLPVTSPLGEL